MKQEFNRSTDENMFPVMKFDLDNRLIYSNVAALPLMKEWNCKINEKLPSDFVSKYPEIFHASISHMAHDLSIELDDYLMHFSLVPFPEAGYIGMYGFCIEMMDRYTAQEVAVKEVVNVNRENK
jgi:hypothetical protein